MAREVAVFDLDGTLTVRDTSLPFLRAATGRWPVAKGVLWAGLCGPWDLARVPGSGALPEKPTLGDVAGRWECFLHERVASRTLTGMPVGELERAGKSFADTIGRTLLRPDALGRIGEHRHAGHHLILASASLEVYLEPLRVSLGFDHMVGTRLKIREGVATGRFDGAPCWGPEKLRRVQEALDPALGDTLAHVYGNSRGDHALLQAAEQATLVK